MTGLARQLAGVILKGLSAGAMVLTIAGMQIASAETNASAEKNAAAQAEPASGNVLAGNSSLPGNGSLPGNSGGSYDLYRGNVQVGTESYQWTTAADGATRIEGSCVVELDGVSTTIHPRLSLDTASLTPISFHYEQVQGDRVRRVDSQFDGGRVSQTIEEDGMSSKRQLKIKPSDLVVNEDVLYQFLLVAERYDFTRAGTQDFTVFDAKTGQNYVAHVMLRGLGTIQNSNGKFRARRLTLNLNEVAVDLYVDSQGRVPMISIPLRGIEARMPGYKGDERAQSLPTSAGPVMGQSLAGQ